MTQKSADYTSIITALIQNAADVQHHHWNTRSYAEHKALDFAYDPLNSFKDDITERLVAYYGRFKGVRLQPIPSAKLTELPQEIETTARALKALGVQDKHTDLDNTGDELLALSGKLKYLLSLT